MRIVIDTRLLQSASTPPERLAELDALLIAFVTGLEQHDVFVVLDAARPARIMHLRRALRGLLARHRVRLHYGPRADGGLAATGWQARSSRLIRAGLIASLDPDLVVSTLSSADLAALPAQDEALAAMPEILWIEGSAASLPEWLAGRATRIFLRDTGDAGVSASPSPSVTRVANDRDLVLALLSAVHDLRPAGTRPPPARKPRLAYVSPLPPERSGISFYSAELLPALARHYDIELIVNQRSTDRGVWTEGRRVRDIEWFDAHAGSFDRIVYHFGNSNFHRHMFAMLARHPGVVVLHDFFLSGVVADMETSGYAPGNWFGELYRSHGWGPAARRWLERHPVDVIWLYPCSGTVLEGATGVIVHAQSTRALSRHWHGEEAERRLTVIPHLRAPRVSAGRQAARAALGLGDGDFVVCAFGGLGPTKLNHRLIDAFLASRLSRDPRCILVFVGSNEGEHYGRQLNEAIRKAPDARIRITGWEDEDRFQLYLAATDIAVQLRALSRGETSGTVLDCMNGGVPLIVNAHGSMADLPTDGCWMLPDPFTDAELVEAIETLEADAARREAISAAAVAHVRRNNDPAEVAARYADAIEDFAARPRTALARFAPALGQSLEGRSRADCEAVAAHAALTLEPAFADRQILIDVSAIARSDLRTGIERAVRALIRELIANPPPGFRIEPVASRGMAFFYARAFTAQLLGVSPGELRDEPAEFRAGDVYFMPDLEHMSVIRHRDTYRAMRDHGVTVHFMVHDLLPVRFPDFFPKGAAEVHARWLEVIGEADQAICVTRAVGDDLLAWQKENGGAKNPHLVVSHSHHGSDIAASSPTKGLPRKGRELVDGLKGSNAFLMVGTVEPRKGHGEVLDAFERLWASGATDRLVIVGKPGWMLENLVGRLRRHSENGRRLFWVEQASDELLEELYAACTCLIAASHGEGFGLPLIEAARHGLPVIARDIPVFREVAGDGAFFFDARDPEGLAAAIRDWIDLHWAGKAPASTDMGRLTWAESAARLKELLLAL